MIPDRFAARLLPPMLLVSLNVLPTRAGEMAHAAEHTAADMDSEGPLSELRPFIERARQEIKARELQGDRAGAAAVRIKAAQALVLLEELTEARRQLEAAAENSIQAERPDIQAQALLNLEGLPEVTPGEALQILSRALEAARASGHGEIVADVLLAQGSRLSSMGRGCDALAPLVEARALTDRLHDLRRAALVHLGFAGASSMMDFRRPRRCALPRPKLWRAENLRLSRRSVS
ncbi:MAG: hypothetical protein AB1714_26375 [Acidobacteriota bacterium]